MAAFCLVLDIDETLLKEVDRRHKAKPSVFPLEYDVDAEEMLRYRKRLLKESAPGGAAVSPDRKHFELDGKAQGAFVSYVVARPAAAATLQRLAPRLESGEVALAVCSANYQPRTAAVVATLPLGGVTLAARGAAITARDAAMPQGYPKKGLGNIRRALALEAGVKMVMVDDKPANFYDELLEGDDVAVASVRDAVPQGRPASEPLPGERACVPGAWTASGELLMACPAFDLAASEALLGGAEGGWAGEGEAEFWAAVEAALA